MEQSSDNTNPLEKMDNRQWFSVWVSLVINLTLLPATLWTMFYLAVGDNILKYNSLDSESEAWLNAIILLISLCIVVMHFLRRTVVIDVSRWIGLKFYFGYIKLPKEFLGDSPYVKNGAILLNYYHGLVLIGTIVGAVFWYVYPEEPRLEPITAILALVTFIISYLRTRYAVPNFLDSVFANNSSVTPIMPTQDSTEQ